MVVAPEFLDILARFLESESSSPGEGAASSLTTVLTTYLDVHQPGRII